MYKFVLNNTTGEVCSIQRLSDLSFIPLDEKNSCYMEYKKWVKEGNKTIEADPPPVVVEILSAPLWKIKIALNRNNRLKNYDDFVSKSDNVELKLFWDKADVVQSDSPLFKLITDGLKVTDKTVNELFNDANNLKV